jgi:uncharacterized protein YegP (UPF0339 family)
MSYQRKCKFQIFKGNDGQWYWRLRATNGQIIAVGGEGYRHRDDAVKGIQDVCACCQNGEIEYV